MIQAPITIDPDDRRITVHINRFTYPFPPDQYTAAVRFYISSEHPLAALLTDCWAEDAPHLRSQITQAILLVINGQVTPTLSGTLIRTDSIHHVSRLPTPTGPLHHCIAPISPTHRPMPADIGTGCRLHCVHTLAAELFYALLYV